MKHRRRDGRIGTDSDHGWSTFRRYWLFQIPGTVVTGLLLEAGVRWGWIERATAATGLALWLGKDLALYPLVRRAYERSAPTYAATLLGRSGRARDGLDPSGYVSVNGELWRARVEDGVTSIAPGDEVVVCGHEGNRLVVRASQGVDRSRST
jgi:membrane-bound ClpP family serine protease